MIVQLHTQRLQTIDEIQAFVDGSQGVDIAITDRDEANRFISQTLRRFRYTRRSRADKGVLRAYLMAVTDRSRAQMTRRIRQYRASGGVRDRREAPAKPFVKRYTAADKRALADLDALHGQLSGPATRRLCQRAWHGSCLQQAGRRTAL